MPDYWKTFVDQHSLVGKELEIPEDADLTSIGAELGILDAEGRRQEAEQLYPGIVVAADGFVPVAGCLLGTGDQYFINKNDGPDGPLYRIYHDVVGEDGYDRDKAVDVVIENYTDILKYVTTEQ